MTAQTETTSPVRSLLPRLRIWPRAGSGNGMTIVGTVIVLCFAIATIGVLIWPPAEAYTGNLMERWKAPLEDGSVLGTDQLGRSLLWRVAAGMPWSLGIAFTAAVIAITLGTAAGLLAAWSPGPIRRVVQHLVDTVIAFPSLVLAVTVIALLGRGFWPLAATLGLATWPIAARVVYAEAMSISKRDYVMAARLAGVGSTTILITHVLPALRPTLLVMFAFTFADMLIAESALSFLGIGVPLTAPSWGNMLSESREYLVEAPQQMLVPATAIVLAVVAFNLIGDGVAAKARSRSRAVE